VNPAATGDGEHLFDDWMNRKDGVPLEQRYTLIETGLNDGLLRKGPARRINVTRPVVCDRCNNEWMGDLTNRAKGILHDAVFHTRPMMLGAEEIVTIVAYAMLKAIVYDRGRSDGLPFSFSPAVAREFADSLCAPGGAQVWVAYLRSKHLHGARAALGAAHFNKAPFRGYRLVVFTYALNHFVCQLTYPRWIKQRPCDVERPFVKQVDEWEAASIPIWPNVQQARWPTAESLDDERYEAFADRWSRALVRRRRLPGSQLANG
jgi:hypothetical protein